MVWENGTDFFLPPALEIFEIQSPMFMANREGGKARVYCREKDTIGCCLLEGVWGHFSLLKCPSPIISRSFISGCTIVCAILVPRPEIKPAPSAVKAWSPNHWTAREFPRNHL